MSEKESFYSELNLEDTNDEDYIHAQKVFKELKIKKLGEYHDLYVQSDTILLAYVFENFRSLYLKMYELDPVKFIPAAWQAAQNTQVKLDLITDIDMFLMIEKGIRGGISNSIYRYAKANSKCIRDYDENEKSSYLNYWDVNNSYGWAMSQKLPTFNFEWDEDISQFNEVFLMNYDEKSEVG